MRSILHAKSVTSGEGQRRLTVTAPAFPLAALRKPHRLTTYAADTQVPPRPFWRDLPVDRNEAFLIGLQHRTTFKHRRRSKTHLMKRMSAFRYDMRFLTGQSEGKAQTLHTDRTQLIIVLVLGGDECDLMSGTKDRRRHPIRVGEISLRVRAGKTVRRPFRLLVFVKGIERL